MVYNTVFLSLRMKLDEVVKDLDYEKKVIENIKYCRRIIGKEFKVIFWNKELLESGVFKLKSFGTGKFGRVLGEVFVSPDYVGEHIIECINSVDNDIDLSIDGWVSVNDILIEEGHAYDYDGGKKKDFKAEIKDEKEKSENNVKDV